MPSKIRALFYWALFMVSALLIWLAAALPGQAHWSDMSAAEILLEQSTAQVNLTYPTGLTPFADDDRNGQLSNSEITAHAAELTDFLGQAIRFTNTQNQAGELSLQPLSQAASTVRQAAPSSHSTVQLTYAWPQPVQGMKIRYSLFLPGVSTASCLATILQKPQQLTTFVFTPQQQVFATAPGLNLGSGSLLLAIGGAVVWGAMHSLSPGHGKTLVGAYLVGSRATPQHAMFLALTTTVTHTFSIFTLGLITLFASRYILPEQLYPWMSLVSGIMVVAIGANLFWSRFNRFSVQKHHKHHKHHGHARHTHHNHEPQLALQASGHAHDFLQVETLTEHRDEHVHRHHAHAHHSHDHAHAHHEHVHHEHVHHEHTKHTHEHHHGHSHLPPDADTPITWRSLLALGISGGLVPCPAALVLLLSCIALGNLGLGLLLVLAFSLGLAAVLTGLGLLLVYAKPLFRQLPVPQGAAKFLPAFSALGIVVIGLGLSAQAALQIVG